MSAAIKVTAIFLAIDKFSSPVQAMQQTAAGFADKLNTVSAYGQRAFNKLTPSISAAGRELLSFAKTAAITAGIVSLASFSGQSIKDYGDAVASFRVIVSDLTDKEFSKFQTKIGDVAKDTKSSSISVAQSFEKIAGLNAKFAETADGLGQVSAASIILSKASGEELGASAESLVGIMNQFSLGADQANRTINVLAAGTAVGAASIAQTSEAMKNFGPTAAAMNIPLEESVALIQTLAKYSINGAEAGTKLRGSIGKLEEAGFGYVNGVFNINAALDQARQKMDAMGTEQQRNAFVTKTFGMENKTAGLILLNNIGVFEDFTKGVTGTNEATKAADLRTNTLSNRFKELSARYVSIITTNTEATGVVGLFKDAIGLLTDNLGYVMGAAVAYVGVLVTLKALTIASTAVTWANIAATKAKALWGARAVLVEYQLGAALLFGLAKTKLATAWTWASTAATSAWATVTGIATTAQMALNTALFANPVGLVVAGIIALIAVVSSVIYYYNEWGAAISFLLGPIGLLINAVMSVHRNWQMITTAFTDGGIIAGIKAIGATIFDMILYPLQLALEAASYLPSFLGGNLAESAAANIEQYRGSLGLATDGATPNAPAPVVNSRTERTTNNNSNLTLDFKNLPKGVVIEGDTNDMKPNLTSTFQFA